MGHVSGIRAQGFRKVLSSTMKIILARDLILVNFSGCHTEAATRLVFCILCRVSKRRRREEGAYAREWRN